MKESWTYHPFWIKELDFYLEGSQENFHKEYDIISLLFLKSFQGCARTAIWKAAVLARDNDSLNN